MLGYNFLVNGVVHCIPFLSKLWQSNKADIMDITDDHLIEGKLQDFMQHYYHILNIFFSPLSWHQKGV